MNIKLISLTLITMCAFAANSIFSRLALVDSQNDPLSFTALRLFSGAAILSVFYLRTKKSDRTPIDKKTFFSALTLFSYALFFSLSYVNIETGTGALILFASVQLTMMATVIARGQKFGMQEKAGIVLAVCGFVYLLLPGLNMPPLVPAALMIVSGISWGVYSLLGQKGGNPIFNTSRNFVFTVPLVALLFVFVPFNLSSSGIFWAILSGALTSGMGYVLWYVVLRDLTTSTAAIVQLSVPAIAAFGGAAFLNEQIQMRLIVASGIIFLGIYLKVKPSKM